jgi:hypothetical protein
MTKRKKAEKDRKYEFGERRGGGAEQAGRGAGGQEAGRPRDRGTGGSGGRDQGDRGFSKSEGGITKKLDRCNDTETNVKALEVVGTLGVCLISYLD